MIQEIREYMHIKIHIFQYILREGNQLADYLDNRAIDLGNANFYRFHQHRYAS